MKALFSNLLMLVLVAAAGAEEGPGAVLEDYYRFSKQEDLSAYYNVIDTQSMGPRELESRRNLTRIAWQRFDTLGYQIEDLHLEQNGDTALAEYRLKATISGPDESGRPAKLETDARQVAVLFLRDTGWKVALVSDPASFNHNLLNIFLLQQMLPDRKDVQPGQQMADHQAASPEGQSKAPSPAAAGGSTDVARDRPAVTTKTEAGTELHLDKEVYRPAEQIVVTFSAPASFANNAWIGVIPSAVPHGSEARNDKHDLSYQYLKKRTDGRLTFTAPASTGSYDMRMHDTDSNGAEVASATFRVAQSQPEPAASATAVSPGGYRLVAKWGGKGSGAGQFRTPIDVTVDSDGRVYVCDMSDRIQKFDADGKLLKTFASRSVTDNKGKFNRPFGLAVDAGNNVYVSDYSYNRIHKFNQELEYQQSWAKMEYNFGIAADGDGNLYVAEKRSNRLRKFDPMGNLLAVLGSSGNGAARITDPYDVALDLDGNIFVVEQSKSRIKKFDHQGRPLAQWGTRGNKPGKFNSPKYLAVDRDGYVYVSDNGNRRVQKFDNHGNFVCQIGDSGSKGDAVGSPAGIAVDGAGNIYVVDQTNHLVKKYAPAN